MDFRLKSIFHVFNIALLACIEILDRWIAIAFRKYIYSGTATSPSRRASSDYTSGDFIGQ